LYAVLAAVLPVVFSVIVGFVPSFPLAEPDFVLLVLWIIGLVIGGWQVSKGLYLMQNRLLEYPGQPRARVVGADLNGLKPIIKALLAVLVPVLYGVIASAYKDFPLDAAKLTDVILWVVGLLLGGWQLSKARYVSQKRLVDKW
jgi:uncharacterized membrane protein YqjE